MLKPRVKPQKHRGPAVSCPDERCHPRYDVGNILSILGSPEFRNYSRLAERKWDEERAQRLREGYRRF